MLFCLAAVAILTGGPCLAGDATFSSDGQRIYIMSTAGGSPALREIDLTRNTTRSTPVQVPKNDAFIGITRSPWDKLALLTQKAIWSWDPSSARLSKIRDAGKSGNFWRIAYDPKSRQIFVTDDQGLFLLKNGREPVYVFVRRHSGTGCPVFTASGEMFFGNDGDLWHGIITVEEGNYALSAYRYAPLGALETAPTTPAETGVVDIAASRSTIYVHLNRLGGTGYGWFAQLNRPAVGKSNPDEFGASIEPAERLPMYKGVLESVKVLGSNPHPTNLCASPDETRVYYTNYNETANRDEDWLITNGQAQQLQLRSDVTGPPQPVPANQPSTAKDVSIMVVPHADGGQRGNVKATFSDGHTEVLTHTGDCYNAKVSPTGIIGWIRVGKVEKVSGPRKTIQTGDDSLVVRFPDGSVKTFKPFPNAVDWKGIMEWKFGDDDKTVIVRSMGHHGPSYFAQYDLASGKAIDSREAAFNYAQLPAWAKPLADDLRE